MAADIVARALLLGVTHSLGVAICCVCSSRAKGWGSFIATPPETSRSGWRGHRSNTKSFLGLACVISFGLSVRQSTSPRARQCASSRGEEASSRLHILCCSGTQSFWVHKNRAV